MSWLLIATVAILLAGTLYQAIGQRADVRRHPPPGRLIDVGDHVLHIRCSGRGGPPVVLDSGIAASSLSWSVVQPEVAAFTHACSYDRAGLAWSARAESPVTAERLADDLRKLLPTAGVPAPYVLVGHSFGAYVVRVFARRWPADVAGMVLVDPIHPAEWIDMTPARTRMLRGGVLFSRLGALLARIGVVRLSLTLLERGSTRGPRQFSRLFGPTAAALLERIVGEVRKLPASALPAVRAIWCQPKCFLGMAQHLSSLPESARQAARTTTLGDMPLVVLASGRCGPDELRAHEQAARLSTRGRMVMAPRSGHWIQLDEPALVVAAIREVVEAVRGEAGTDAVSR